MHFAVEMTQGNRPHLLLSKAQSKDIFMVPLKSFQAQYKVETVTFSRWGKKSVRHFGGCLGLQIKIKTRPTHCVGPGRKMIIYRHGAKSEKSSMHKKEHENTSEDLEGKTNHEQNMSK
jgi:hypothetical protein